MTRWILGIFVLSLTVKLFYIVALLAYGGPDALILGDSTRYLTLAQHVVAGNGYTYDGYIETYRAPGYPLYLMFFVYFGIPLVVASLFQSILASLLPLVGFFVAFRFLKLSVKISGAVGALIAIEPVLNFYGVTLMPDVFFSVGLLSGIFCFYYWLHTPKIAAMIYGGIFIGITNYFRPAGLYLTLLLVGGALIIFLFSHALSKEKVLHLALFVLIPIIIMAPWCIRNYIQVNHYGFVSALPYNTYTYTAASAEAASRGIDFETARKEFVVSTLANAPDPSNPKSFANSSFYLENTIATIQRHPQAYIHTYLLGLNTFWFSGNYHYVLARYGLIDFPKYIPSFSMLLAGGGPGAVFTALKDLGSQPYLYIAIAGKVFWLMIFFGALLGAITTRNRPAGILFILLVVYFSITILPMTIGVEARHRYPMNPLLFAFFAAGVMYALELFTSKKAVCKCSPRQ